MFDSQPRLKGNSFSTFSHKRIGNLMYVFIKTQLTTFFKNCFGFLSRPFKGKGSRNSSAGTGAPCHGQRDPTGLL
jgi:hypothetical protein